MMVVKRVRTVILSIELSAPRKRRTSSAPTGPNPLEAKAVVVPPSPKEGVRKVLVKMATLVKTLLAKAVLRRCANGVLSS